MTALKNQMSFEIQQMTSKANAAADNAIKTAQIVGEFTKLSMCCLSIYVRWMTSSVSCAAEKLEPAIGMADRINVLRLVVADYAEQLNGFDAGLTTQVYLLFVL